MSRPVFTGGPRTPARTSAGPQRSRSRGAIALSTGWGCVSPGAAEAQGVRPEAEPQGPLRARRRGPREEEDVPGRRAAERGHSLRSGGGVAQRLRRQPVELASTEELPGRERRVLVVIVPRRWLGEFFTSRISISGAPRDPSRLRPLRELVPGLEPELLVVTGDIKHRGRRAELRPALLRAPPVERERSYRALQPESARRDKHGPAQPTARLRSSRDQPTIRHASGHDRHRSQCMGRGRLLRCLNGVPLASPTKRHSHALLGG
jgi:hypothetical protein